jgi:hypothetical protein
MRFLIPALLLLAGCESVPQITFDLDGSADDAAADGPALEGAVDAADAADAGGCPETGGSSMCCGSIPCVGQCDQKSCDRCAKCAVGDICCIQDQGQGQVECKQPSDGC